VKLNISDFIGFLSQEGRTVIYFVASAYALYFYHTKIGFNLNITYQIGANAYTDTQITKLVVSNLKDKSVPIWSIYAVLENDVKIEIYNPKEPIVLKSGEAVAITPERYTSLHIGSDHFEPDFFTKNIEFYINVGTKFVKCNERKFKESFLKNITKAKKTSLLFDGHLYNESVEYILVYFLDGKKHTAFIDTHGFIGHEWNFLPNSFGETNVTPEKIERMLEHCGYASIFSNYVCFKQINHNFEIVFKKQAQKHNN
jgi:hypothetical protein